MNNDKIFFLKDMNLVVLFRHANFKPIWTQLLYNIQDMGGIPKYIGARCPFVLHGRHTRQGGIKFKLHIVVSYVTLKYIDKKRKFVLMKWGCVMKPYVR